MKAPFELNYEQEHAVIKMLEGYNVFLTGPGGTGKTEAIGAYARSVEEGHNIAYAAPTGLAASKIKGSTLHRLFNLPKGIVSEDTVGALTEEQAEVLRNIDTLVIDEISMVRSDIFQIIHELFCKASPEKKHLPFAGTQIIVSGDFYQLPPIEKEEEVKEYTNNVFGGPFAFQTPAWKNANFVCVPLEEIHRQQNPELITALNAIRTGDYLLENKKFINNGMHNDDFACVLEKDYIHAINKKCLDYHRHMSSDAISICMTNREADKINYREIRNIDEEAIYFEGRVLGDFPDDSLPVEKNLLIKVGMKVIICANNSPCPSVGYVNGDTGIVLQCFQGKHPGVLVQLDSGREVMVCEYTWQELAYSVDYDTPDGKPRVSQEVVGRFTQLPLSAGYACTVHKSQGQTFDAVRIILANGCFSPGQLYVALSRCRSWDHMTLDRPINYEDSIVSEEVRQFYAEMYQQLEEIGYDVGLPYLSEICYCTDDEIIWEVTFDPVA